MSDFLEERLSVDVKAGARYGDDYEVRITETAGGSEFRELVHPYAKRRFEIAYLLTTQILWDSVLALYHRAYGRYAGFRVRCSDDFSTNGRIGTPTAFDQTLTLVSAGVYQLLKAYGAGATPLGIGLPTRTLFKPVANTTHVGIVNTVTGSQTPPAAAWAVDTVTGRVTFAANKTAVVTAISQAASAVLTIGAHAFVVGDSAHVSGVAGMTQINGRRAAVTAIGGTTITLAIDSSAFSPYTSGGAVNSRPQTGETVKGGCEFDIPCRFDTVLDVDQNFPGYRDVGSIQLVELLNP